jgi:hypothetical protein
MQPTNLQRRAQSGNFPNQLEENPELLFSRTLHAATAACFLKKKLPAKIFDAAAPSVSASLAKAAQQSLGSNHGLRSPEVIPTLTRADGSFTLPTPKSRSQELVGG